MDSVASPELAKLPVVEIKYERMDPKDSLFRIDGAALGQTIVDLGYPPSVIKPLIIDNEEQVENLAVYDPVKREVIFHQKAVIDSARRIYIRTLKDMGEVPPQTISQEDSLFQKIFTSRFFNNISPLAWPYIIANNNDETFFAGNPQRMQRYLKAAKEGNLMQGKPLEEQRARARAFIDKLAERALHRHSGLVFAHEYEHVHDTGQKFAIKTGLGAASFLAGLTILDAITREMYQRGTLADIKESTIFLGILSAGAIGLLGLVTGRAREERISNEAGFRNMSKFMDCFEINHEIFAREVLGKEESTI